MNGPDETRRELKAARARIAALSAAILRTSASLDLATVLGEAVDTARALTSARYGITGGCVNGMERRGAAPQQRTASPIEHYSRRTRRALERLGVAAP